MLKQPDSELRAILNRLTAVAPGSADAGRFNGAKVGLYKNDFTPGRSTVLGDVTPATYTGYAKSAAIVFNAAFTNSDGAAEVLGDLKQFLCSADGTAEIIYGYYIENSAGTGLLWAERFAVPVTIDTAGDNVAVLPRYVLGR